MHLRCPSALALLALLGACATPRSDAASAPTRCDFASGLTAVEAVPTEARVAPVLAALATACPERLGTLAVAAQQAQPLARPQRARVLGDAASQALPPACATPTPEAPASSVSWGCPPPPAMALSPQLLEDADAGTYLFVIAVRSRLDGSNRLDAAATTLLDNLLLAAALEGEAARGGAPGTPPL